MILVIHNRYRTTGGEEQSIANLLWLLREHMGEEAELLERDSALLGRARAAVGMLRGGLKPEDVAAAVRRSGAKLVHAHNIHPAFGWRALAAAQAAGAKTVLHLHNYRLVCAVGTCFTQGEECLRCHGNNTLPGVIRNCRGNRIESSIYGTSLTLWQRQIAKHVDLFVTPSKFARDRLLQLGAPIGGRVAVVGQCVRSFASASEAQHGKFALVAARLAVEKGVEVAIAAARQAGLPLVIAGDGPQRKQLEQLSVGSDIRFLGKVGPERMEQLRGDAALAMIPSLCAEVAPMAAVEALAAGVPVVGSSVGSLPEFVDSKCLVTLGSVEELQIALQRYYGNAQMGNAGIQTVQAKVSPAVTAAALKAAYRSLSLILD